MARHRYTESPAIFVLIIPSPVDPSFLDHVIQTKSEAFRLLDKVLGGACTPCVLKCCYSQFSSRSAYSPFLHELQVVDCGHKQTKTPSDCLDHFLSSLADRPLPLAPHALRIAFAVQEVQARRRVGRKHAGVPLLFMSNKVVLMLEPPSPASVAAVQSVRLACRVPF